MRAGVTVQRLGCCAALREATLHVHRSCQDSLGMEIPPWDPRFYGAQWFSAWDDGQQIKGGDDLTKLIPNRSISENVFDHLATLSLAYLVPSETSTTPPSALHHHLPQLTLWSPSSLETWWRHWRPFPSLTTNFHSQTRNPSPAARASFS